ncbi:MAG TPA: RNA polymerase sigma factor [Gemmataceae bacterium]
MSRRGFRAAVAHLRRVARAPEARGGDDAELLERFLRARDESAFELLTWRHGGMVLGVCRRLLRDRAEAEDAFQATFLALALKAGSIGRRRSLGAWLYKVACRVALDLRARRARRDGAAPLPAELPDARPASQPAAEAAQRELRDVLDREVGRLPEPQRVPVILCYFEGKTNEEAAREIGCPVGTVVSRLARARERLRRRLARSGVTLSAAPLALALPGELSACVPAALAQAAARSAVLVAAGQAAGAAASVQVASLTEGVLNAMFLSKVKTFAAVLLAASLIGAGVGSSGRTALADPPAAAAEEGSGAGRASGRDARVHALGKVKQVDAGKGTITISGNTHHVANVGWMVQDAELMITPRFNLEWKPLHAEEAIVGQVAPGAKVLIDGREGKLSELTEQTAVELTIENGKVTKIVATGSTIDDRLLELTDPDLRTLTLRKRYGPPETAERERYVLGENIEVRIDGRDAHLSELKGGMRVALQTSAVKPDEVIRITAAGPTIRGFLRAIDLRKRTIDATLTQIDLLVPGLEVAEGAAVTVGGKPARFADLKPGMRVELQMAAEADTRTVVAICVLEEK